MTARSMRAPEIVNATGCTIRLSEDKGRGVYASLAISAGTLVNVSPVLLFNKSEYETHGKHTILDNYTFNWPDGRKALALGLGSLFNHSDSPNVSFVLDILTESIRYTVTRNIQPDEELYIFYGHNLWFAPADRRHVVVRSHAPEEADDWLRMSLIGTSEDWESECPPAEIPFEWLLDTTDVEKEGEIRQMLAWVVDIPDPRQTSMFLGEVTKNGWDTADLEHLKRIRKTSLPAGETQRTMLITSTSDPPILPSDFPTPQIVDVPMFAAKTKEELIAKNLIWPTNYMPKRPDQVLSCSRGKAEWTRRAMDVALKTARSASERGELPIASCVPPIYEDNTDPNSLNSSSYILSSDTRNSTHHPLRHSVLNLLRQLGETAASHQTTATQNGIGYLLTGRSFFTTHEPCVMCSMALLHSRVQVVYILNRMPRTGGCGGVTCLSTLKGVNHRFRIAYWKDSSLDSIDSIDESIDA